MRVFATRPLAQNTRWANTLAALGHHVVETPLLDISPVDTSAFAEARAKILNLNEYSILIFVSQNAVAFAVDEIDEHWPQLPLGLNWYSVGQRTHTVLRHELARRYGFKLDKYASGQEMNSEALLALPTLQHVEHEKVLIFRGRGGRPLIADVLSERGAVVEHCELYERKVPKNTDAAFAGLVFGVEDVLPVFSAESLNNFMLINKNRSEKITDLKLIVPGQRVADHAKTLGFCDVTVAENATEQAMLAALSCINQEDVND